MHSQVVYPACTLMFYPEREHSLSQVFGKRLRREWRHRLSVKRVRKRRGGDVDNVYLSNVPAKDQERHRLSVKRVCKRSGN